MRLALSEFETSVNCLKMTETGVFIGFRLAYFEARIRLYQHTRLTSTPHQKTVRAYMCFCQRVPVWRRVLWPALLSARLWSIRAPKTSLNRVENTFI